MTALKVEEHYCNTLETIDGRKEEFIDIGEFYRIVHQYKALHSVAHKGKRGEQLTDIGQSLMSWLGSQRQEKKTIL